MTHKYQSISSDIEQRILSGYYSDGNKLPTEEELGKEFNVSRNTIRKAVDTLVKRGYIMAVQGSGMFIRNIAQQDNSIINLENFRGLTADFQNSTIESQIIEFNETIATESLAEIMNCAVGTELYYINRLRIIDGKRWVVEYSYYNKQYIPFLNEDIINDSIYDYIRNGLNRQIGYVDRVIEAAPLNLRDAHLLGLQEGDPALISTNKSMFKTGEIFDYSIDIHHYKYTKFLKLSNL
ncbi:MULTISPECIES: GntR family transcriptional regulator [Erysipelothrix]|uniref:GntR family transcriptional regulator n=1 Tax=Erysipelothrix TaxID=1647 RepID=UPI00135ABFCE|nr:MULTISPECIES: GntR family transcriptional regulator [Erysipelothrix]